MLLENKTYAEESSYQESYLPLSVTNGDNPLSSSSKTRPQTVFWAIGMLYVDVELHWGFSQESFKWQRPVEGPEFFLPENPAD